MNIGVFPHIYADMSYDPIKDFVVIGEVAGTPGGCVVDARSKIQSFADIINEAKAKPGKIRFGSSGTGSPSHITVEMLAKLNGVKFIHVPYRRAPLASADILNGSITFACLGLAGALPLIREGKLRAIGVIGERRSVVLPDVPTVKEAGFGDVDDSSHYILVAPAMTPKPIVEQLSNTLAKVLADSAVQDAFIKGGFDLSQTTPAEITMMIKEQHDRWGPFVKELNLTLE